ncbi:MAG: hypothetical protein ACK5KL_20575 [Dysgonomonas sp.]
MQRLSLFLFFLITFTLACAAQNYNQDNVHLKDGSVIKGVVIEQIPNKSIKIKVADGSIYVYSMDLIEKIVKEEAPLNNQRIYNNVQNNNYNPQGQYGRGYDSGYYKYSRDYDITGYRGFVDFGYTIGVGDFDLGRLELLTSHGAQINPYFFIGAGTGVHYYCTDGADEFMIPFFADFRGSFMTGVVSPVIGLKAGYTFDASDSFSSLGLYIAPSLGVRYMVSDKTALNFSVGYTHQRFQDASVNLGGISFKIGVEF